MVGRDDLGRHLTAMETQGRLVVRVEEAPAVRECNQEGHGWSSGGYKKGIGGWDR